MFFRHIPETVTDFKWKQKNWYGFEKALKALELDNKTVLARLKRGQLAYEDSHAQSIKCQKANAFYCNETVTEREEPRTVRLKEKTKVILKGRSTKQQKEPTENRATSSNEPMQRVGRTD